MNQIAKHQDYNTINYSGPLQCQHLLDFFTNIFYNIARVAKLNNPLPYYSNMHLNCLYCLNMERLYKRREGQ